MTEINLLVGSCYHDFKETDVYCVPNEACYSYRMSRYLLNMINKLCDDKTKKYNYRKFQKEALLPILNYEISITFRNSSCFDYFLVIYFV